MRVIRRLIAALKARLLQAVDEVLYGMEDQ